MPAKPAKPSSSGMGEMMNAYRTHLLTLLILVGGALLKVFIENALSNNPSFLAGVLVDTAQSGYGALLIIWTAYAYGWFQFKKWHRNTR